MKWILLVSDIVVKWFGRETIHDTTKKFASMNLLQMCCMITKAYLFLTSMEAVIGQKPYSDGTLWHFNSMFCPSHSASSAYQKKKKVIQMFTNKWDQPPYLKF